MKTTNLKFYESSLVSLIIIHEETKKFFICIKIQTIVNRKNMRFLDENRQFTPNRERCKAYTGIFKLFEYTTVFVRVIHEQLIIFVT